MPTRTYKIKRFTGDKLDAVTKANDIISQYMDQGYKLTVRQIYYRFVAADLFPDDRKYSWTGSKWIEDPNGTKNAQPNYTWLGDILSDARMGGYVDWESIEDRTRELEKVPHWDSPADIVHTCGVAFRLDKWVDQKNRVEVWVEKDALEGIVKKSAHAMDVSAFSCRGYTSMSSMWEAAQRLKEYVMAGQSPIILHLGDHDPSGIDMTRDIQERLNHFLYVDYYHEVVKGSASFKSKDAYDHVRKSIKDRTGHDGIRIRRIALNMDQVEEYNPPPNPAKSTDSRFKKYVRQYGPESWELDALEPTVLDSLITDTIAEYRADDKYNALELKEDKHRDDLSRASKHWDGAVVPALAKIKDKRK